VPPGVAADLTCAAFRGSIPENRQQGAQRFRHRHHRRPSRHHRHHFAAATRNTRFLAEEGGRTGESEFVGSSIALDGTTNFLHGFRPLRSRSRSSTRAAAAHAVV